MVIVDYLRSLEPLEILNAVICFGISFRLMCFRQGSAQHKVIYSFLAYILIVATAAIGIRILMKHYTHVDIWEVIVNGTVLIGVVGSRGNIARFVKVEFK